MVDRREVRFIINAYTPETMPMARLAEYMTDLAVLLGEPSKVHFSRVEAGSLALVQWIELEGAHKVEDRLAQIRHGEGPPDAMNAMKAINRKLREDNSVGVLTSEDEAEILKFPGRDATEALTFGVLTQQGSLDGVVIRLGGTKELVPVHLQSGPGMYMLCFAHRDVAKRLAPHIFTTELRVYGTGRWYRDEDGKWTLERFTISDFAVLNDEPLTAVVTALRAIPGSEWADLEDPWAELSMIRTDPDEFT
jgi:hypothetical protein